MTDEAERESRFTLDNVSHIDLDIHFLRKETEGLPVHKRVIEAFQESRLKQILELKTDAVTIYDILDVIESGELDSPLLEFSKDDAGVRITPIRFSMILPISVPPYEDKKKGVTQKQLHDASELANKSLLLLSNVLKPDQTKSETQFTFRVPSKIHYLDHLLDARRIDSAEKLDCTLGMVVGRFRFKPKSIKGDFEMRVQHPLDHKTGARLTNEVEFQCEFSSTGGLDVVDLLSSFSTISDITSKATLVLGV